MTKPAIILASASIGRKHLLEKLGVPFSVLPSDIDEDAITHTDPFQTLRLRARAKAEDVANKLSVISRQSSVVRQNNLNKTVVSDDRRLKSEDLLVIAADSMAILDGKAFGKAKSKADAHRIVTALMGKTHEFVTATSIIRLKSPGSLRVLRETQRWEDISRTAVTTRFMSDPEIDAYLSRYDFSRFAAGYALNETPWDWVTKIDGSYTNVIGLPFEVVLPILKRVKIF